MAAGEASALVALLAALVLAVVPHYSGASALPAVVMNNHTSAVRQLRAAIVWQDAKATWYGRPDGAGPDDNGGACGFKNANQYPFMSMTSCGNQPLFLDGQGCGACYRIKCNKANNPACSNKATTVMITDMNYYPVARYHFDLSGTAFGSLAWPGLNDRLRSAGIIDIQFRRVPCINKGLNVNFHVVDGSNPNYLAVLVEYVNRAGTVLQMDVMESNSGYWMPMHRSWGSIWRLDSYRPLIGPFTVRIISESGATLVAYNVIPANWTPNTNYGSNVQFN